MIYNNAFNNSFNIFNLHKNIAYNRKFFKDNPDYFIPDGLVIFVGSQGSGKTLSAVRYVYQLKKYFPNSILVTNIDLKDFPVVSYYQYINENKSMLIKKYNIPEFLTFEELQEKSDLYFDILFNDYLQNNKVFPFINSDDLSKYNNGKKGVIFLIDEIQLYFNSLESKNIDPQVMVQISQQRKQRKHIVATSQVFGRMAKPLREQFSNVILCKSKFFNKVQWNQLIDKDSIDEDNSTGTNICGKVIDRQIFFRSPIDFERYDTYNIINNNFKNIKEADIYGDVHNSTND